MKIIRGINNLAHKFKKPVLTIGIFDGVHLAHQKIIKEVVRQAKLLKGTSIVLTFKAKALPLIISPEYRMDLIGRLNVDVCLLLGFNKRFLKIPDKDFIKDILVDAIGINYLIVGEGFRFGKGREGTFSLLQKLSKTYNFKVRKISPIKKNGKIISSSRIRTLLQRGKIREANKFLGRRFSLFGKVKKGSRRGRILGYPTANIEPEQQILPCSGVYAVFIKVDSKISPGILNIGYRPTFSSKRKSPQTVEVHIFNFRKNIYGKRLKVLFIQRIRSEKKFSSRQTLLEQIKKDELKAKGILHSKI